MVTTSDSTRLFPRRLLPEIEKNLDKPGAILLVGARQVGKTSILYLLMGFLRKKGVTKNRIFYLDLEDMSLLEVLNRGVAEFLAYLTAHGAAADQRVYVFVDEIQYMENPTNFLKLMADHHKRVKLIVSGSSTLEIRRKFKDSLAGRKAVFEVHALDFYEYLIFKGEEKLAKGLQEWDLRHIGLQTTVDDLPARFFARHLETHFYDYLSFGAYPGVVLEPEQERKIAYLMDIYNSYVRKDIKDLMRVDNVAAFNNLIKVLALQIGNLVNITELCTAVKIARETLERYLFLLENTFIIKMVSPFSSNPRKEISKMSKVYFMDTGLRNMVIRNFSQLEERVDAGVLVENGVFCNLLKNLAPLQDLHFWRTLAKSEVDFVVVQGKHTTPIECKYAALRSAKIPKGIRQFARQYSPRHCFVLTKGFMGRAENTTFLPVWLC
jgi:hypothetical protein